MELVDLTVQLFFLASFPVLFTGLILALVR